MTKPPGPLDTAPAPAASAIRIVAGSPLYLGATVAMFLSGLATSAAAPQIALFLVNELDASLTAAGLFYLTNLAAPVAGYLIGARSDRTGSRLGLFRICAALGFVGWLGIALSTQLWVPYLISAVVLGFAGAATSQIFAALHDELHRVPLPNSDAVVNVVRMALTAGWVVGPFAGSLISGQFGIRAMLVATAVCTLAQIVPLGFARSARVGVDAPVRAPQGPGLGAMLPLLAFTGLYICVYAGESIKYAYLPIYMVNDLRFSPGLSGAIIGIQPLVELFLMPVAVLLSRRTGILPLMIVGACFGVLANLCFAFTGTAVGLFAGQILMGGVWGIFATLGIIVAQRLLSGAVATASAIFLSSTALSSALGGLTGGLGADWIGLPLVFLIPATFAAIAAVGLFCMSRLPTGRTADRRA